MSRRKLHQSKKGLILPALLILALVALVMIALKNVSPRPVAISGPKAGGSFPIEEYRRDGSRFASSGNRYFIDGRVENIEGVGNARMVSISVRNNRQERLPLLVQADTELPENLTRGDTFVFEVECRTGRDAEGKDVKGVLLVRSVRAK